MEVLRIGGESLSSGGNKLKCGVTSMARSCSICKIQLGRIFNRGAFCSSCHHRVCKFCREYAGMDWICIGCFQNITFQKRNSNLNDGIAFLVSTVKKSVQRSLTFTDKSSPWAAFRDSPELRVYNSMPHYEDYGDYLQKSKKRLNKNQKICFKLVDSCGTVLSFPEIDSAKLQLPFKSKEASQADFINNGNSELKDEVKAIGLHSPGIRRLINHLETDKNISRALPSPPLGTGGSGGLGGNPFLEGRFLIPDRDEYRLVFISSGSSNGSSVNGSREDCSVVRPVSNNSQLPSASVKEVQQNSVFFDLSMMPVHQNSYQSQWHWDDSEWSSIHGMVMSSAGEPLSLGCQFTQQEGATKSVMGDDFVETTENFVVGITGMASTSSAAYSTIPTTTDTTSTNVTIPTIAPVAASSPILTSNTCSLPTLLTTEQEQIFGGLDAQVASAFGPYHTATSIGEITEFNHIQPQSQLQPQADACRNDVINSTSNNSDSRVGPFYPVPIPIFVPILFPVPVHLQPEFCFSKDPLPWLPPVSAVNRQNYFYSLPPQLASNSSSFSIASEIHGVGGGGVGVPAALVSGTRGMRELQRTCGQNNDLVNHSDNSSASHKSKGEDQSIVLTSYKPLNGSVEMPAVVGVDAMNKDQWDRPISADLPSPREDTSGEGISIPWSSMNSSSVSSNSSEDDVADGASLVGDEDKRSFNKILIINHEDSDNEEKEKEVALAENVKLSSILTETEASASMEESWVNAVSSVFPEQNKLKLGGMEDLQERVSVEYSEALDSGRDVAASSSSSYDNVVGKSNSYDYECMANIIRRHALHMEEEMENNEGSSLETPSCLEEGLADDDSWVEELDNDDFGPSVNDEMETFSYCGESDSGRHRGITAECCSGRFDLDFTLHTIVEESCEESETEEVEEGMAGDRYATDLEKYFVFEIGQQREEDMIETADLSPQPLLPSNTPVDTKQAELEQLHNASDSDTSSTASASSDAINKSLDGQIYTGNDGDNDNDSKELSSASPVVSKLEKYFLSGFMGFDKRDDSRLGSDSESGSGSAQNSPDPRRKRLFRSRGGSRTIEESRPPSANAVTATSHDTFHGDGGESSQANESWNYGICEKIEKNGNMEAGGKNSCAATSVRNLSNEGKIIGKFNSACGGLIRKDSFSNWSSDEETNVMMSKMRAFFKSMIASRKKDSAAGSLEREAYSISAVQDAVCTTVNSDVKPPQLLYFESELTRLMKTVPGIREDQVKEIVEYLSSEDTWSDSCDSSDYTSSDLEGNRRRIGNLENSSEEFGSKDAAIYYRLLTSLQNVDAGAQPSSSVCCSSVKTCSSTTTEVPCCRNSPPLITKVMQHIGTRLVALMRDVSEVGDATAPGKMSRHHRRLLPSKLSTISTTTEEEDEDEDKGTTGGKLGSTEDLHGSDGLTLLSRSKSHDPLLSEENRQEASDNERFSWRGSFESALLAVSDSRTRLSSAGENSASALAKRRSAGDLMFKCANSREHLDRVRSCGSIGEGCEEKMWSMRPHSRKRRSSMPDASNSGGESADGDDDSDGDSDRDIGVALPPSFAGTSASAEHLPKCTTLPRVLQSGNAVSLSSSTNSLPRLSTPNIYNKGNSGTFAKLLNQSVKSARYRPPGYNVTTAASAASNNSNARTYSAPPRRSCVAEHVRRGRKIQNTGIMSSVALTTSTSLSSITQSSFSAVTKASTSPVGIGDGSVVSSSTEVVDCLNIMDEECEIKLATKSSFSVSRSDSMASVYSGAGEGRYGSVAVRGEVEFGLQYNYKAGDVEIFVKQCRDLAPVDVKRNRSDPYVKIYLLPDKSKSGKRKTRVKKHTLNPVFDEVLKYNLTLEELETRTLWLSVWNSDMFGRNDFLGEVAVTLENKVFDDPTPKFYHLQERSEFSEDVSNLKGHLVVALKYVPCRELSASSKKKNKGLDSHAANGGSLHVLVKEAKNLTSQKSGGSCDPFCKGYLLPNKGRSCKQKTPVLKRSCHPIWNHSFVYNNVSLSELRDRCLELTIWDHDRLASNEFLGGVRLSLGTGTHNSKLVEWMDSNNKETMLWQRMLERPNFWVESCMILRPSLDMRKHASSINLVQ